MNDLEQRVREAFNEVELPLEARERALAAIAQLASQQPGVASLVRAGAAEGAIEEAPTRPSPSSEGVAAPAPARRPARIVRWRRAAMALAACLALVAVGFTGVKLYFEETAFVGIDVNPSLELGINRFDVVVSANAFNADGQALLDAVPVTGKTYDDAVSALTSSAAFAPYVENDAYVEISVIADDARQSDELRALSDAHLSSLPCEGSCHAVDADVREAAAAAGMGVGRYETALELLELDDTLTLEECASMSMRELRDRIAALKGDADDEAGSQPNGSGRGGGDGSGHHYGAGGHGGQGGGAGQGNGRGAGERAGQHADSR